MTEKVKVKLTGTVFPDDVRALAQALAASTQNSGTAPQDKHWKIFRDLKVEQFRNELTFNSDESQPTIRAAFNETFSRANFFVQPKEGAQRSSSLTKRPVGYEMNFGE